MARQPITRVFSLGDKSEALNAAVTYCYVDYRKVVKIGLTAVALSLTALFVVLGMWQLNRAADKRAVFAEFESRGNAAQVNLNHTGVGENAASAGYRAAATGRYRGITILLDNQIHQGRAGYLVYTALKLDGRNESVLINRGWVSADANRSHAPEIATPTLEQRLAGRLSPPPTRGLRLRGDDLIERLGDGIWRVQAVDFAALTATLGVELMPITVLLDGDAPDGFVRTWKPPGSNETRHLGYAFQWFALALTVMVVTVVVALRRGRRPREG